MIVPAGAAFMVWGITVWGITLRLRMVMVMVMVVVMVHPVHTVLLTRSTFHSTCPNNPNPHIDYSPSPNLDLDRDPNPASYPNVPLTLPQVEASVCLRAETRWRPAQGLQYRSIAAWPLLPCLEPNS